VNNSTAAAEPKTATLLIVNREPKTIAGPLTEALNRHNTRQFHVETMRRAEQLIARVHTLHPDILLLGFEVPGADSLTICRTLKTDPDSAFVSVIMTNVHEEADALASFEAGADDLLGEPPHPGEIVARVRLLLRLKKQYDLLLTDNQRLTERLIVQNQALETALGEVNAARQMTDNITYNLTHELRTPLLQVKSAVAMMQSDGIAGGAALMTKLIGFAGAATKRLEAVVSDLDQLVAAMNPPKFEAFRLQDAIQGAIRHVGRNWRWNPTDAVARISIRLDDMPAIYSDRAGVSQVLQHVLDNALKFSPGGEPVEIEAVYADEGVWVSVSDYGVGIPESELLNIFRAFYQVNSSTTRQFGGVGIGLTIVKLILTGLNAPYVVESTLGKGTVFRFRLPIWTEP
jgi:signal transduction histidine kinase